MGGGTPLKDPGESAKDRIYRSAARLYALHGYDGTSIREIAEAAGVTKPLVHYHFESKERLFSSLLDEALGRCGAEASEIASRNAPAAERLRELVRALASEARRAPEVTCFAQEALTMPKQLPFSFDYKARGRSFFEIFVGVVEDGRRRGEFRDVDPRHIAAMLIATVGFFAVAVLSGELEEVPGDLGDFLFDVVMRGMEVRAQ